MSTMGGACSMHRSPRRDSSSNDGKGESSGSSSNPSIGRRYSRHSVVVSIPDDSISKLYPVADNYETEDDGTRSPKSLADLCTETLCRSLAYLDGDLPPGLPQDVVDDVVNSLVKHNAINATTLRVLKNCELGSLTLAGCRGVTDEWLRPLACSKTTPFSTHHCVSHHCKSDCGESMEIDEQENKKLPEIFYNASTHEFQEMHTGDESSCSTSSFVSASSTHRGAAQPVDSPSSCEKMAAATCPHATLLCPMFPNSTTCNITLLDLRGSQRLTDKGLRQLSDLSSLEVARLDNCHSIVGRGLVAFSNSHHMHTLSLANCRRLTDEAIINISHLNSLQALSLDGCRCLTNRSLAAISGLYRLKKLDLSQCDLLTDEGLEGLDDLDGLEELALGWCRNITDDGLESLSTQSGRSTNLRVLCMARCSLTSEGMKSLARLEALEVLDLNGCSAIGSAALAKTLGCLNRLSSLDVSYCPGIMRSSWQGKVNGLRTLELGYSGVRDSHLSKLTSMPCLEEISFDSCPVTDWAIAHIADNVEVPKLKSLDLADTDLTDLGMVHIAKLSTLTRLSLFYCNISNGGLRHLGKLKSLEVLNLDSREIGDDGLRHLRNLKFLRSLDIFSGRITDSGCSHIASIKSLESLELCGGGVSDMGCTLLASLENLSSLNLSQNDRITNRGAAALAALSNLKALNLSNTRVTSAALPYFSDLTRLQSLALYGCRGMDVGDKISKLQNGIPSLKCIRLNNSSDDDGIVSRYGDETTEESEDEDEHDSHSMVFARLTDTVHSQQSSGDSDEDSEMEDVVPGSSSAEGSSSSDASYYSDVEYQSV